MSSFDDAFADRAREVFDAYHEPVDHEALDRMRAALGHPPAAHTPLLAPDRAPVARQTVRRRGVLVALAVAAAVVVAGGVWLQTRPGNSELVAEAQSAAPLTSTPNDGVTSQASVAPSDAAPSEAIPSTASESPAGPLTALARPSTRRPEPPVAAEARTELGRAVSDAPPAPTASRATGSDSETEAGSPVAIAAAVPEVDRDIASGGLAADAAVGLEGAPAVLAPAPVLASLPTRLSPRTRTAAPPDGLLVVLETSTPVAGGASVEGIAVAGGLTREWPIGGRLSVSGGALVAYARTTVEADPDVLQLSGLDFHQSVDVTTSTDVETVALEIPLDLGLNLIRTPNGSIGLAVGVTSAVYFRQQFEDQGQTVVRDVLDSCSYKSYQATERSGLLSRVDLARQLNVALRLGHGSLATDVYARLPLGGLTDRDLGLTSVGVRLRVPLR